MHYNTISNFIQILNNLLWSKPVILSVFALSAVLTVKLRFFHLFHPIKLLRRTLFSPESRTAGKPEKISRFQALSTALAASMGTGNIIGVSAAISIGGSGAVLWMIISAFFVMSFAYAENYLGVKYNALTGAAEGPMPYIRKALRSEKAACFYAAAAMLASFGTGSMSQANSVSSSAAELFPSLSVKTAALISALICLAVISCGGRFIASLAEKTVPLASVIYILAALAVIISNAKALPAVFSGMISSAFGFDKIAGGFAGTLLSRSVTTGLRRGIFSNEAGMGSSVFAHTSSDCKDPETMGLWAVLEVFTDTVLCCTLTALAILCTGAEKTNAAGTETVAAAFESVFGRAAHYFVPCANIVFAFASVLGWYFYGEKCAEYLSGGKLLRDIYRIFYAAAVYFGAVSSLDLILGVSDIFNALMMFPNLVSVMLLSGEINREKLSCPPFKSLTRTLRKK